MNNLEKLVKYLVNKNDVKELSLKTGLNEEVVKNISLDVLSRIIPGDFTRQEGSHVEEKDLRGLVSNFNEIIKEDNLREVLVHSVKKYSIDSKSAASLLSAMLPIIHKKIQGLTEPKKEEVNEEVDEIFSNISKRADEEEKAQVKAAEEKPEKKKSFFVKKEKTNIQNVQEAKEEADEPLTVLEKVCVWAVVICLVALVILFTFVLIKINMNK